VFRITSQAMPATVGGIPQGHDAEPVVLDLVQPVRSGRRPIGGTGKTRLNETG
jgi:hypothetical protein